MFQQDEEEGDQPDASQTDQQLQFGHFTTVSGSATNVQDGDARARGPPAELSEGEEDCSTFIVRVSELVDKYWNGSKSLLKNQRFKCKRLPLILVDFCSIYLR